MGSAGNAWPALVAVERRDLVIDSAPLIFEHQQQLLVWVDDPIEPCTRKIGLSCPCRLPLLLRHPAAGRFDGLLEMNLQIFGGPNPSSQSQSLNPPNIVQPPGNC